MNKLSSSTQYSSVKNCKITYNLTKFRQFSMILQVETIATHNKKHTHLCKLDSSFAVNFHVRNTGLGRKLNHEVTFHQKSQNHDLSSERVRQQSRLHKLCVNDPRFSSWSMTSIKCLADFQIGLVYTKFFKRVQMGGGGREDLRGQNGVEGIVAFSRGESQNGKDMEIQAFSGGD